MNTSTELANMFEAFGDARRAFGCLCAKGLGRSDQELSRDPDYRLFYRSGVTLARIGGIAAIQGAITLLGRQPDEPGAAVQAELERLWAGMGTWKN